MYAASLKHVNPMNNRCRDLGDSVTENERNTLLEDRKRKGVGVWMGGEV